MSEKKNLAYHVSAVLKSHTDGEHSITRNKIAELLLTEHQKKCDLRAISSALDWLIKIGAPIKYTIKRIGSSERKTDWRWNEDKEASLDSALSLALISSPYLTDEELQKISLKFPEIFRGGFKLDKQIRYGTEFDTNKLNKTLSVINKAIIDNNMLLFSVFNFKTKTKKCYLETDGRVREYLTKPIQAVCLYGVFYLYCELGDTDIYRFFPIHRLHNVRSAGIKFLPNTDIEIPFPTSKTEAESILIGTKERAVIRIKTERLGEFCERFGGEYNVICSYANMCEVELQTNLRALKELILSFGADIEALLPTKLRRAVATELQKSASKYTDMRRYHGIK